MAQNERPRPHGDPLRDIVKDNPAQRQSDVPPDSPARKDRTRNSDREGGRGSTANGIPALDDDSGMKRRRQYDEGADLVSEID
jgi:hypothetical protein